MGVRFGGGGRFVEWDGYVQAVVVEPTEDAAVAGVCVGGVL